MDIAGRRRGRRSQPQALRMQVVGTLASAVALCCAARWTQADNGEAFVTSPATPVRPLQAAAVAPAQRPAANGANAAVEFWASPMLGCFALLGAAAMRAARAPVARKSRTCSVHCFPAPSVVVTPQSLTANGPSFSSIVLPTSTPTMAVSSAMSLACAAAVEGAGPETTSAAACSPSAARFVGGSRRSPSRRPGRRTRTSAGRSARRAAARASRRHVGERLRPSTSEISIQELSYDVSKIRTKLQLGLRVSSASRSERGRESRTPSTSEGTAISSDARIQAKSLGEQGTEFLNRTTK